MMEDLIFPPLMHGHAVHGAQNDPFDIARIKAAQGVDAGLLVYNLEPSRMRGTFVFAPEVPLGEAMVMLPICALGFQNALGALAPPELAVHLEWNGDIRINGAKCGRLRVGASSLDSQSVPDWLCVGLELSLWPECDETGHNPDTTALYAEGCADVDAPKLIEAWARHTLNWLTRWEDEGNRPVHLEWRGLAHGMGEEIVTVDETKCTFLGVDENFGQLLRQWDGSTTLTPLTHLLEVTP